MCTFHDLCTCTCMLTLVLGSLPYACAIFTYDLWTPRNEKSGREPGIFYHVSDIEGREMVERLGLCMGGQRCLPTRLCSWPDIYTLVAESLLTCRKAILALTDACTQLTKHCSYVHVMYSCTHCVRDEAPPPIYARSNLLPTDLVASL